MTSREEKIEKIYEVIGEERNVGNECCGDFWIKEIMIGDCDDLISKGPDYFDDWIPLLDLWSDKRKPIDDQSDECVDFIYSLIKDA